MRIASGVSDQYIYFIALSSTDGSRLTGLSSFTVYRSRNGGAATAFTTPTINETSSANMPGVYELLLDEDMTIDSGDYTQAMVFHITATGMQAVTREIELFLPDGLGTLEGSLSRDAAQRVMLSALAGKVSGAGTGTETFRDTADSKDRIVSTVDSSGNRTAVTLDGA